MTDTIESHIGPEAACPNWLLKSAINNLSLGLLIFDGKYQVVYCNDRYMEIYGLSPGQVRPGTPISTLIQHRLKPGFRVLSKPDEQIRGARRRRKATGPHQR